MTTATGQLTAGRSLIPLGVAPGAQYVASVTGEGTHVVEISTGDDVWFSVLDSGTNDTGEYAVLRVRCTGGTINAMVTV